MYLLNFSRSLASIVNVFDHTKYVSLNNQACMTQPSLIDSHPDECNQDCIIVHSWLT